MKAVSLRDIVLMEHLPRSGGSEILYMKDIIEAFLP